MTWKNEFLMAGRPLRRARMARVQKNPMFKPSAAEGYLKMLADNMRGAVNQIESGEYPQYDANTRRNLMEEALSIVKTREEQLRLDSSYPVPKIVIAGLSQKHFPGSLTMGEMHKIRRYIEFGQAKAKANPAGWMHDESARAVRKAIASRSPEDIRRARALQVRNEKARSRDRSYLPNPKKNGGCACGCGGTCGKKNPESYLVYYNGFVRKFSSKSAAQKFARSIRGGGVKPVVKRA